MKRLVVNTEMMNCILFAWAACGDGNAGQRAEAHLDDMENSFNNGSTELRPDARSYGLVISAWSKSSCSDKFRRALGVLRRLEKVERSGSFVAAADEHSRSLVINACGFSNTGVEVEKEAFEVAVQVFDEVVASDQVRLTSLTIGWFVQACGRLRVPEEEKSAQIERAFHLCCEEGLVNDFVLQKVKIASTGSLYRRLLGSQILGKSQKRVSTTVLPSKWKRNVWQRRRKR